MFKGTKEVPSGAFSAIVEQQGGNDNAFTTEDYTAFFQRVAADRLDLMMKMEADRMRNLRLPEQDVLTERNVIIEERKSRTDSSPGALLSEQMRAAQYMNSRYGIPITRATVLTHAEVQPTLGVRQRGKWDITWLPGMSAPGDPIDLGDVLRARISAALGQGETVPMPTLQRGAEGEPVRRLQAALCGAGLGPAKIDGDFGPATDAAVRRFQSAKGLWPDGIVGPKTWAKLNLKG